MRRIGFHKWVVFVSYELLVFHKWVVFVGRKWIIPKENGSFMLPIQSMIVQPNKACNPEMLISNEIQGT